MRTVESSDSQELSIARPILVIEDNPEIRSTFRELLESEGYSVQTACHGRDALDLLEQSVPPAVIFLDLQMPVMDGEGFLEVKRQNPLWAPIPVIVFSVSPEKLPESPGVSARIKKPVDVDDLLEVLEECYEREAPTVYLH